MIMYQGMITGRMKNKENNETGDEQQKYLIIKNNNYFINVSNIKKIIFFEGENMKRHRGVT